MALEQLRRKRRAEVLDHLRVRRQRDVAHVLDTAADRDVVHAGRDERRREVHGLLRRPALAVDRRRRRLDRQARLQPRVAADVVRLLAVLLHAAGDHVLDEYRVDAGAIDHLDERRPEQDVGMDVLVVALLRMPAPHRGADSLDDHDLTAFHCDSFS